MILWTRGMQVLTPFWHILPKNSKHSHSGSKKNVQNLFLQKNLIFLTMVVRDRGTHL